MKYIDYDHETGKITRFIEMEKYRDDLTIFPDTFEKDYTWYKYINGKYVELTPSQRNNMYFNGIDPTVAKLEAEMTNRQSVLLEEFIREAAIKLLSDKQCIQIPLIFSKWSLGTDYVENDKVRYGGLLYKCLENHTALQNLTPDISPIWQVIEGKIVGVYPQWVENCVYNKDMVVTHKNNNWISDVSENTFEPGKSTTWTKIG